MPEPGGPLAPPIFGRSVNPIRTGEGRLSPPITTGPLNVFHLPASLNYKVEIREIRVKIPTWGRGYQKWPKKFRRLLWTAPYHGIDY